LILVPPMSMTRTFMIFRIRAPRCELTALSLLRHATPECGQRFA
jgi:hypothetical protein